MSQFLTVKEAARTTGKSPSSIRRVIYPIIADDKHPDREHIEPSIEDVLKLRMKGENFAWRLSEELLRREVPVESVLEKGSAASLHRVATGEGGELLAMLTRELDIKNGQITQQSELIVKQMELINGLGERLREGNILIGSLQQRLTLTDGRERPTSEPIESRRAGTTQPEKGIKTAPNAGKPRKSFLARLFS